MNNIVITSLSNATLNGLPGAICDLIANHPDAAADIQRAAVAYEATLNLAISLANAALTSTQSQLSTLNGNFNQLMIDYNAATTPAAKDIVVAKANALTTAGQLAILQKKEAEHQANLTITQAQIAALTPNV